MCGAPELGGMCSQSHSVASAARSTALPPLYTRTCAVTPRDQSDAMSSRSGDTAARGAQCRSPASGTPSCTLNSWIVRWRPGPSIS